MYTERVLVRLTKEDAIPQYAETLRSICDRKQLNIGPEAFQGRSNSSYNPLMMVYHSSNILHSASFFKGKLFKKEEEAKIKFKN